MQIGRTGCPAGCVLLAAGMMLVLAAPAAAQYGGSYQGYQHSGSSSGVSSPPPTPTPRPMTQISMVVRASNSAGSLIVDPGKRIGIQVTVRCIGPSPARVTLAAMALDDRAGIVAPSRGSVPGSGTWNTAFQAGKVPGSYRLLFVAQDPSDTAKTTTRMVLVQVAAQDPALIVGGQVLHPVHGGTELFTKHRSWRSAVSIRTFIHPNWVEDEAKEILKNPDMRRIISDAVRLDRQRIGSSGKWPEQETFRSYSHVESVMSRYWADAGLNLSAATANEVGNVFLAWRRGGGMTVTLSEEVAASAGAGSRFIKVGNVLNAVGVVMIGLDFWNNMSSAESPVEAREAWYKAGYGSVDLYLANVIANTFGAAVALPGMFASYILNSSYDTLIKGHKQCWFKQMVRVAAAEDYLGKDIHDTRAVQKVKAAMASPKGLKAELMDWWLKEGPNWDGWMGGCGSWSLTEARGYRKAFVDRLMRTAEVEVDGVKYHPWSFYYSVSRMLVREQERKKALEMAEHLRDLEAAYLQRLHDIKMLGQAQLLSGGGTGPPLKGAAVAPHAWRLDEGWRTDEGGNVTLRLRGDDLSPQGTVLLDVRTADEKTYRFLVPKSALVEVR